MTEFSTEAQLSFSDSSLQSASRQLERELSTTISVETDRSVTDSIGNDGGGVGTTAAAAAGTQFSGADTLEESVELDQERNTMLSELLEATERSSGGGGGGGGVGDLLTLGSIAGMLSGTSLASLVTPASLGTLVTKASASVLVKGAVGATALITGGVMVKNLIQGDATASDIIKPLNNLGDLVTGPIPATELIETGVGLATFIAGGVSIASFVTGTSLTAMVSGVSLSSLVAGGTTIAGMVASAPATAIIAGVALTALVTAVSADFLIDGKIDLSDYAVMDESPMDFDTPQIESSALDKFSKRLREGPLIKDPSGTAAEATGGNPNREKPDAFGDVNRPGPNNVDGFSSGPSSSEIDDAYAEAASVDIPDYGERAPSYDEISPANVSSTSTGGNQSTGNTSSGTNQARDRTGGDTKVDYTANINADLSQIERKLNRDLRKFKQRIKKLENGVQGGRR